jgi:hypothetical protein
MPRKRAKQDQESKERVIDAGRAESPILPADPEIQDEFNEAQRRGDSGSRVLGRRLKEHTSTGPKLSGGDVDADWEDAEFVGDEAASGDNPTPDQIVVEDIGEAMGDIQEDEKPLHPAEEKYPRRKR